MTKKGIPDGWLTTTFDVLLDYIQPTKYIVKSTEYDDTFKTPVLTAGKSFIKGYTNEVTGIFNTLPVIIFDDFTTATKFVNFPFKVKSSAMKILVPTNKSVNVKFVFYYMQTLQVDAGTHKRYWISDYSKRNILVPPLPEQHRIVAKIEELFSKLDNGVANLKKAKEQLKVYRQSVLKWAFEGRLTNKDVKAGILPDGWENVVLEKITDVITDGDHQPPPKTLSGIPFITISNVNKRDNSIDFSRTFFVSFEYYNSLKTYRKPVIGDILYTVTGSFGIPILINYKKQFCFQRHIGLVRPSKLTNQKWLYYILQSPQVFSQAEKTATGTAQKTVALKSLRNFSLALPPLEEQHQIVQEIESRLSVADNLEKTIDQSLKQAEALRQSILKRAFEGRLVAQDANDEVSNNS